MADTNSPINRSQKRRNVGAFGTQPKSPRSVMSSQASTATNPDLFTVAGRLVRVELENFMCHGNLKVDFNIYDNNCFYIGGPNGSGKSALFSAINIGLGGTGRHNDRGNAVKQYIKNGKTFAKIKVILSNTGQGRCERYRKDTGWEEYGDDIIIERSINPTSTTYSIKTTRGHGRDRKEYLVSHKKADLDVILARFGIELNNPIYWLSQDKARSFLSQTDPRKMFQIFMDASDLETTQEEYKKVERILKDVHENIESIHAQLLQQRKDFNKMKEMLDKKQKEKDLLLVVQRLQWLSHVAPLRDAEDSKKIMEEKVKKTEAMIIKLKQEQSKTALDIQGYRKALAELAEHTSVNKREGDERSEFLQELNEQIEPLKLECKHLEDDLRKYSKDIESAQNEIHVAHRKIQEQERRMNSNEDRQNLERYEKSVAELEQLQLHDKENIKEYEKLKKEVEVELAAAHKAVLSANEQSRAAQNEYRNCRDEVQHVMESEKNMIARFGAEVPAIMRIIEANANRFSHKPKGPIGSYVKVRDNKYLLAIESALRNNLRTFLFDNHNDEQTFKRLLERERIRLPQTIVARFGLPPHQTRGYEPEGFLTILNALDIADVDIRNILIDVQNIESTILFDSDQEAREVMNGNLPRNAKFGYSISGAQIYGSNRQGGNYRFYACHNQRVQFLSDFAEVNKDNLRQQLELAKRKHEITDAENRKTRGDFDSLKRKYDEIDANMVKLGDNLKTRKGQINNYNRQIERIKESDDGDTVIQAQERLVEEYEDMMRGYQNKIDEAKETIVKKRKHLAKLTEQREAFIKETTEILQRYQTLENEALELKKQINEATEKNNRCDKSMQRLEETKEKLMDEERVAVLKEIDRAKENLENYEGEVPLQPDGSPEEPNYNEMPSTDEIDELLRMKTVELDAMREALDIMPSVEEMQKKKEEFNDAKKRFSSYKALHAQLNESLAIRRKKFPVIQHAIVMKLKSEFTRLIKFKFTGELLVNTKKGEIKIKVKPHGGSTQDSNDSGSSSQEALKDIRGLSGGERSYTTTCFLMALWYIMETPFRCMDEFDVFMDGHTRKTAMDLIVRLATEDYPHQQFIFFTPQGINELTVRDGVATFEMPKVRDI